MGKDLGIQASANRVTVLPVVVNDTEASCVLVDGFTLAVFYGPACDGIGSNHAKEATLYVEALRERFA